MRSCIFCNKRANSVEDAWPVWLMNRFPSGSAATMEFELREQKPLVWSTKNPRLKVRRVCSSCNNGWMSMLEDNTKPIIESILDDKMKSIDIPSQETLARWSVKTVMVLETIDSIGQWFYSVSERNRIKTSLAIPIHTKIWIAKCINQPNSFSLARNLHGPGIHSYVCTMVFGILAIQVMTIHPEHYIQANTNITYDVREGPWDETWALRRRPPEQR